MEPISNTGKLALLLRQRLLERSRAAGGGKLRGILDAAPAIGPGAARALAQVDGVDERQLRRALVQDILADQFGSQMLNQAQFQQIIDSVTSALEDDAGASALLTTVVSSLRASAG